MNPAPTQALVVEGLTKSYGGVAAMADVSFSVEPGRVHALLGENGAGKSTLVKCLAGAVQPDGGLMTLFGEPYAPRNPAAAIRQGVGVVFQELSLIPDLTVAENIWFRREAQTPLRTINTHKIERATEELFERYDLTNIPVHRPVRELSVSQRQLVETVKVISTNPRLFILDEATSALSPNEVEWTHQRARELVEAGASVIYISHRLAEARAIASDVTVFRGGRNVTSAALADTPNDDLIYLMLGRRVENLYPPKPTTIERRPMVDVKGLTVGSRVRDVDLTINAGEILGVGGIQGQGQLELFQALYGVVRASGQVTIDGHPVRLRTPQQALAAGIALVPEDRQSEGLFLPLTIRENIAIASLTTIGRLGFITQRAERRAIEEVVRRLRVKATDTEQEAGSLSGGNQQKVVIAKFLQTDARVFLLYDLTRGVDIGTKAEIFELMRALATAGMAVLFYSTELAELVNVADRVAVISDGVIQGVLEGDDLTEASILRLALSHVPDENVEVA
jgi:ribose transport system ATP-binding protein